MDRKEVGAFLRAMALAIEDEASEDAPPVLVFLPSDSGSECYVPDGVSVETVEELLSDFEIVYWSAPDRGNLSSDDRGGRPGAPTCPICATAEHVVPVAGGIDESGEPLPDQWVCCGCNQEWQMGTDPPKGMVN